MHRPCTCRASASIVVEKETNLVLEADAMTAEGLAIIPRLLIYMTVGIPSVSVPCTLTIIGGGLEYAYRHLYTSGKCFL
jgi:hypothetical protein